MAGDGVVVVVAAALSHKAAAVAIRIVAVVDRQLAVELVVVGRNDTAGSLQLDALEVLNRRFLEVRRKMVVALVDNNSRYVVGADTVVWSEESVVAAAVELHDVESGQPPALVFGVEMCQLVDAAVKRWEQLLAPVEDVVKLKPP